MRPTGDRVREAAFDVLGSMGGVATHSVLDLFAGTGALGIEALSRGAARATFVDHDPAALEALRVNLVSTGLYSRGTVVNSDVLVWLATGAHFDIAFADPPYAFDKWDELAANVRADLLVMESDRELPAPAGWSIEKAKQYGGTVLTLVRPVAETEQVGDEVLPQ